MLSRQIRPMLVQIVLESVLQPGRGVDIDWPVVGVVVDSLLLKPLILLPVVAVAVRSPWLWIQGRDGDRDCLLFVDSGRPLQHGRNRPRPQSWAGEA